MSILPWRRTELLTTSFALKEGQTVEDIAARTFNYYLSRLPATTLLLPEIDYGNASPRSKQQVMTATSFLSNSIIHIALAWVIYGGGVCDILVISPM